MAKFRLIPKLLLAWFLLLSEQINASSSISLVEAAQQISREGNSILIVGADHENSGLTSGITSLLNAFGSKISFNCLFLELPTDIQKELDKAIEKENINIFTRAFLNTKINPTIAAYKRLGAQEALLEKVKQSFEDTFLYVSAQNSSLTNAMTLEFIKFLRKIKNRKHFLP